MKINITVDSLLTLTVIATVLTTVPVKLAAEFVGARYTSFTASAFAVLFSLLLGYVGWMFSGIGVAGAFVGAVLAFWLVLRPGLGGAILIPMIAFIIQVAVLQVLGYLGT